MGLKLHKSKMVTILQMNGWAAAPPALKLSGMHWRNPVGVKGGEKRGRAELKFPNPTSL